MENINRSNLKNRRVESAIPIWPSREKFRFVDKNGRINVDYSSRDRVKSMHSNVVLFIMQSNWCFVLTIVLFGLILSWFFFALLYFLVSIEHGDFAINEDEQTLLDNKTNYIEQQQKTEQGKCVQDVHNFLSALLFSIETQQSIGYGSRYITTECMGGILVLTLQSSLGYLLQVIVMQIVFTKLSRPTGKQMKNSVQMKEPCLSFYLAGKSQFVVFSHYALIAPRNNRLTLTFRIGNLSVSQLIFSTVRLLMIRQRRTVEGEVIPHQIYDMELTHLRNGQLFFPRPTVLEHIIDSRSPLYGIQRSTLTNEHFEIIAIIEGSFDYTGFSCHFRTSYLPDELHWGYQFASCDSALHGFDYDKFNDDKLIYAQREWNYEEQENSCLSSPDFSPGPTRKLLPHRKPARSFSEQNSQAENSRLPRLEPIISVPYNPYDTITSIDSIIQDDSEKKITENNAFLRPPTFRFD